VLPLEGLAASELSIEQREALLALLDVYLGRWPDGHRERERELVVEHLDETLTFAWIGDTASAPFYYKLHSPVILVEFDHHPGIFLDNDEAEPFHVHTIVANAERRRLRLRPAAARVSARCPTKGRR